MSQKLRLCKHGSSRCGKAGHDLKQCAEIAFKTPGKIKGQRTDQTDDDPRRSHNKISVTAADPLFRLSDPAEKNAQDQRRHHGLYKRHGVSIPIGKGNDQCRYHQKNLYEDDLSHKTDYFSLIHFSSRLP